MHYNFFLWPPGHVCICMEFEWPVGPGDGWEKVFSLHPWWRCLWKFLGEAIRCLSYLVMVAASTGVLSLGSEGLVFSFDGQHIP